MKKIRVYVTMGLVGCKREVIIEVDDDYDFGEIEDIAREQMWELIEWGWQEVEAE